MKRYRIILYDIGPSWQIVPNTVCEGMLDTDARDLMMQLQNINPNNSYEIEEYNLIPPEGKGIGRDPDLH